VTPTKGSWAVIKGLGRHRQLIWQLTRRELAARYRGSLLGFFWAFLNPVLMLLVYTFVFSVAFKARWPGATTSRTQFALILFSGLIVFTLFTEPLLRSPTLIIANPNYVKKIVFPLEVLPCVAQATALFNAAVSFGLLLAANLFLNATLHWTLVFLPVTLLPVLLVGIGLSWFLVSLGTFLRDIGPIVGVLAQVLMFMTPIFYPLAALPQSLRGLVGLNPLAFVIEQVRGIIFYGQLPDWPALAAYLTAGLLVGWGGLAWFQRTRNAFANVL
jgi:lipopolysaccharide transport system permease protein